MSINQLDHSSTSKIAKVYANCMRTVRILLKLQNAQIPYIYWLYSCTPKTVHLHKRTVTASPFRGRGCMYAVRYEEYLKSFYSSIPRKEPMNIKERLRAAYVILLTILDLRHPRPWEVFQKKSSHPYKGPSSSPNRKDQP